MDLNRTNFSYNKQSLDQLLQLVSIDNPSIGYYQGMNCIAAFLMSKLQDVGQSHALFNHLLKNTLEDFVKDNFSNMNQVFFLTEYLVKSYLPLIYQKLYQLEIKYEFFIAPYILTIFSSAFQSSKCEQFVTLSFLMVSCYNAPGFFRVLIALLKEFQSEILSKDHDQLLSFLNKQIFTQISEKRLERIFRDSIAISVIQQQLDDLLKISNHLHKKIKEILKRVRKSFRTVDDFQVLFYNVQQKQG